MSLSSLREQLAARVEAVASETGFSGAVRVDVPDAVDRPGPGPLTWAFGLADRRHGIENQIDTRFAIASGTKAFTALTVMSMVESGLLALDTTARSVLGPDLPLIDDAVTVEHLLAHRSGIGDYLEEQDRVFGHHHPDRVGPLAHDRGRRGSEAQMVVGQPDLGQRRGGTGARSRRVPWNCRASSTFSVAVRVGNRWSTCPIQVSVSR